MATKAPKNEVAKTGNQNESAGGAIALMSDQLPDWMRDQTGAPRGAEDVTADDLVIPRLELVQSLSPCRKRNDPAFIEGAEEGMLYNNVTRELYGPSVIVFPVFFRKEYVVFKDRKKGGGFRGAFGSEHEAITAKDNLPDGEGNDCEVVDMAQHFCLLANPLNGRVDEIVISMSKSKLKVSRRWNSVMRLTGMDTWARAYEVSGIQDSNDKGEDFYNLNVKQLGFASKPIHDKALALYESIKAGKAQVNRDTVDEGAPDQEREY
jgi:hypothetical protein